MLDLLKSLADYGLSSTITAIAILYAWYKDKQTVAAHDKVTAILIKIIDGHRSVLIDINKVAITDTGKFKSVSEVELLDEKPIERPNSGSGE
jgi:hypothetical protein